MPPATRSIATDGNAWVDFLRLVAGQASGSGDQGADFSIYDPVTSSLDPDNRMSGANLYATVTTTVPIKAVRTTASS